MHSLVAHTTGSNIAEPGYVNIFCTDCYIHRPYKPFIKINEGIMLYT